MEIRIEKPQTYRIILDLSREEAASLVGVLKTPEGDDDTHAVLRKKLLSSLKEFV